MALLKTIVALLFGADWKTSLVGLAAGAAAGGAAYASGHSEPGFYLVALGLMAVGRLASDAKPKA